MQGSQDLLYLRGYNLCLRWHWCAHRRWWRGRERMLVIHRRGHYRIYCSDVVFDFCREPERMRTAGDRQQISKRKQLSGAAISTGTCFLGWQSRTQPISSLWREQLRAENPLKTLTAAQNISTFSRLLCHCNPSLCLNELSVFRWPPCTAKRKRP